MSDSLNRYMVNWNPEGTSTDDPDYTDAENYETNPLCKSEETEIRVPKEIRSPNSETGASLHAYSSFGLRISFGFRGFGLRTSISSMATQRFPISACST